MARQLKPMSEEQNEEIKNSIHPSVDSKEKITVITTEQLILNEIAYIKAIVENLNRGLDVIIKQAGFDPAKN